jgi:hypothetical protein
MSTKAAAIASFRAALRTADETGHVTLTAASAAGLMLAILGGNADAAEAILVGHQGRFMGLVRHTLEQIALDDVVESLDRDAGLMSAHGAR